MLAMNESSQKHCMGDEEDGCDFFASQIREMEVVVSQTMRAHQGKNQKGNVVNRQHHLERKQKRGKDRYGWRANGRFGQKEKRIMWKEKDALPQSLQVKRNNTQDKNNDIRHQKVITANQGQVKQTLPIKITEQQIYFPCQQRQKEWGNFPDKSVMQLSHSSNQKSTDMLNMAYIECHQVTAAATDEDFTAFLVKQFGQSSQLQKQHIEEQIDDYGSIMESNCNIECVNIDLNPKKMSKKQKKVQKGKNQKIILQKNDQNCLQINIGQSILTQNDPSINKSSVQSQKSIIMATAISRQLQKLAMEVFQSSPFRMIDAQIFTNGCVEEVKIERILIKPFEMMIQGGSSDKIVKFNPNETRYKFPSRQYYDRVKKIQLCEMRVPQLSINLQKNDEYYEILGGFLIKIDSFRLKCTSCSRWMNITINNSTNECIQSCQKCSMALKIVVNYITIRQQ